MSNSRTKLIASDLELQFPATMDNTNLSNWASCPRQWYWERGLGLQPKTPSIHLHAGKAYAAMLEVFRKAFYDPSSSTYHSTEESTVQAVRALLENYGYDPVLEATEQWAASPKTPIRLIECFLEHLAEYPPLTDAIQPYIIDGKPAIENSFSLIMDIKHPDTNDPISLHGRYDMLVKYGTGIYVFDDKTCSQLGPTWFRQWEFRSQFTGYCIGAETYDIPVVGAIVRGHCILTTSFKFGQSIARRENYLKDQWWDDTNALLHSLTETYKAAVNDLETLDKRYEVKGGDLPTVLDVMWRFPATGMFNGSCEKFSGCSFRELCGAKRPERWLPNYEVRRWNPLDPSASDAPLTPTEED